MGLPHLFEKKSTGHQTALALQIPHDGQRNLSICAAQCSYASAVLGVVILSICLSIHHTHALWQNQTMHCWYFDTTWKGNHSSFLTPAVVGGWRARSYPHPFEERWLQQISTYNISTVRDSKTVQLWQIGNRARAFQRATAGVRTLPQAPKGWLKKQF